jgi:lipoic acid synthetase
LGESEDEVLCVLRDLRKAGCSAVTIGQYLQPTPKQAAVQEFIAPGQFKRYEAACKKTGFIRAFAGPFVRSSYRAADMYHEIIINRQSKDVS